MFCLSVFVLNFPHHKNWHTRLQCGSSQHNALLKYGPQWSPLLVSLTSYLGSSLTSHTSHIFTKHVLTVPSHLWKPFHYASLHSAKNIWNFCLACFLCPTLEHDSITDFDATLVDVFVWLAQCWFMLNHVAISECDFQCIHVVASPVIWSVFWSVHLSSKYFYWLVWD